MTIDQPLLQLSKLDAARRQLETAIALYFQDGDPVSIHTLACAAHEIIQTLNHKSGGQPTLKQQFRSDLRPDYVKRFYVRLDAAKNFFKHADKDPDALIQFSQFESEIVMLDACWTHRRFTGGGLPTPLLGTFILWSTLTWAKDFVTYEGLDSRAPEPERMGRLTRAEFFKEMLPIARLANGVSE